MKPSSLTTLVLLLLAWAGAALGSTMEFDHEYPALTSLLRQHVNHGRVNYQRLKTSPAELDSELARLATVTESEFQEWPRARQLAFLINLYNATTLQLVRDHYPVESIRKIGGPQRGPWSLPVVKAWGRVMTLDELEHRVIRKRHHEPRIRFALVCAARSGPFLREEAYTPARLEAQLHDQGIQFFRRVDQNCVDATARTLWLSEIFRWFEPDFTRDDHTLHEFVLPYLPAEAAKVAREVDLRIRYSNYDWALNDIAPE